MSNKRSVESLKIYLKRKYDFLDESIINKIIMETLSHNERVSDDLYSLVKRVSDENIILNKEVKKKFSDQENQTIAYQLGSIIINMFKDKDTKKTVKAILELRKEYIKRANTLEVYSPERILEIVKSPKFISKISSKLIKNKDSAVNVVSKIYRTVGNSDYKDIAEYDTTEEKNLIKDNIFLASIENKEDVDCVCLEGYETVERQTYQLEAGAGKLYFDFKAYNSEDSLQNNAALISIKLIDINNKTLLPLDTLPVNKNLGPYVYIDSGAKINPVFNEFIIEINDSKAKKVELSVVPWKKNIKTYIQKEINSTFIDGFSESDNNNSEKNFINYLSSDDKVILLYTTAPYVEHETLELRPNRMAKEYIKLGYKVIFFSFSRVPDALVMPEKYENKLYQCLFEDITKISSLVANRNFKEKIFICSSFPDVLALTTMNKLKLSGWTLAYEVRDDMEEFNRVGYSKWYNSKIEVAVIGLADKVITVSPRLAQKMIVMAKIPKNQHDKVIVIQNAAPDALIDKTQHLRTVEIAQKKNISKKVGYIGHLTPAWFDWALIINAAKANPVVEFEIIGHGMPKNIELPNNVSYLGPKTHDEFIEISKSWRAGLIPFIKSPLTYGVDPNKVYEYLAVGLMVITADMGSVRECPATYVYDTSDEFNKLLGDVLVSKYDKATMSKIRNYVRVSRWSMRAKKLLEEL